MEIKKYQKWTALVLVLCMLFSMTGCADEEKEAKQVSVWQRFGEQLRCSNSRSK